MNRIHDEHHWRNADSRDRWNCFANHRRHVTEMLVAANQSDHGTLCVLGAGNCNDLDLPTLTNAFSHVHLVDLDEHSLQAGIASQDHSKIRQVTTHGGIELTGTYDIVHDWSAEQPPSPADVQACLDSVACHPTPSLSQPFDVVASVCLLTQLIDSMSISLGGNHARFLEVVTAIRCRHLRLLFELSRPGGTVLLITDFVSSVTCPALATTTECDLPGLAAELLETCNFFTGVNPAVLHELFQSDPVIAPQVSQLRVTRPWLWNFGPRTYAVCGISARSRTTD